MFLDLFFFLWRHVTRFQCNFDWLCFDSIYSWEKEIKELSLSHLFLSPESMSYRNWKRGFGKDKHYCTMLWWWLGFIRLIYNCLAFSLASRHLYLFCYLDTLTIRFLLHWQMEISLCTNAHQVSRLSFRILESI